MNNTIEEGLTDIAKSEIEKPVNLAETNTSFYPKIHSPKFADNVKTQTAN